MEITSRSIRYQDQIIPLKNVSSANKVSRTVMRPVYRKLRKGELIFMGVVIAFWLIWVLVFFDRGRSGSSRCLPCFSAAPPSGG